MRAVADFLTFGTLPFAGALWDQPDWLLREMRIVLGAYREEEARQMKAALKTNN